MHGLPNKNIKCWLFHLVYRSSCDVQYKRIKLNDVSPRMNCASQMIHVSNTQVSLLPNKQSVRGPSESQRAALAAVAVGGRMTLKSSAEMYTGIKRLRPYPD